LLHEGHKLPLWHPLVSGAPNTVRQAGVSMQDQTVSESVVPLDDWEDYLLDD